MIDFTDYIGIFRLFVILTSWCEIKMIDFTEGIHFFDFLTFRTRGGGQNDQFYLIHFFSDFSTSCWEVKLIDLLDILEFFVFSTFRSLAGNSNLLILQKIWIFSTFRLFDLLVGGENDRFY